MGNLKILINVTVTVMVHLSVNLKIYGYFNG